MVNSQLNAVILDINIFFTSKCGSLVRDPKLQTMTLYKLLHFCLFLGLRLGILAVVLSLDSCQAASISHMHCLCDCSANSKQSTPSSMDLPTCHMTDTMVSNRANPTKSTTCVQLYSVVEMTEFSPSLSIHP